MTHVAQEPRLRLTGGLRRCLGLAQGMLDLTALSDIVEHQHHATGRATYPIEWGKRVFHGYPRSLSDGQPGASVLDSRHVIAVKQLFHGHLPVNIAVLVSHRKDIRDELILCVGQIPAHQVGGGLVDHGDMTAPVGRDDRAGDAGQGRIQPVPLQLKFRAQARFFAGVGNGPFQADGRHMRLLDEIESARLHGRHRQGGIPMAGQEHNGSRRQADVPVQGFKHLEPAHVRQAVVDQHAIWLEILNGRQAGRAQFGLEHVVFVG